MKKALVIIKIGGSVITEKGSNKSIFKKAIARRLFSEIRSAGKFKLILVHGAGSFGHPLAKKYRLNEGYINSNSYKGVALTKSSVLKLNRLVLDEMNTLGLNSALVETSAVATT